MKIASAILGIVVFLCCAGVAVFFARKTVDSPPSSKEIGGAGTNNDEKEEEPAPAISAVGPFPKAVVEQDTFAFPPMQANTKGSHTFIIRNDGAAPLKLARGKSTCKCTMSKLAQNEIPPGESAGVTLEWQPQAETEDFRQTAKVHTNDPERKAIDLTVTGPVQSPLRISPFSPWAVGEIPEGQSQPFQGAVTSSSLDEFKILSLECSNPDVKLESVPLTDEEKEKLSTTTSTTTPTVVKSGYSILGTIPAEIPIGTFLCKVKIVTDVVDKRLEGDDKNFAFEVVVSGRRAGPLTLFGPQWIEDKTLVEAGRVDPLKGKKLTLSMYVRDTPEEGLKLLDIQSPECIIVSMTPDPKFTGKRKRYLLELEFVPDKLLVDQKLLFQEHPIKLKTNHPRAAEFEFRVVFTVN